MLRFTLLLFLFYNLTCKSQLQVSIAHDSLLKSISAMKADTNKVVALMKYGWWWETYNMDSAAACYLNMHALAQKLNYTNGELRYYANYTYILNQQGKHAKSLSLNLEALKLAKLKGSKEQVAVCLFNTGSCYNNMTKYDDAIACYLQAITVFESLHLIKNEAVTYDNIGGIFSNIGQTEKGLTYHLKALDKAKQINDSIEIATASLNAGMQLNKLNKLPEAETYINTALAISKNIKSTYLEINATLALAEISLKQNHLEKSITYAKYGLQNSITINSLYSEMEALKILTRCYYLKKDYVMAIEFGEKAIAFGKEKEIVAQLDKIYDILSSSYYSIENYQAAYKNVLLSKKLTDSVNQKQLTKEIENLEIGYQTKQKENEIVELQTIKKQQQLLIGTMSLSIVVILLISYLVYKNYRQKRFHQKQRIYELETEKKLITSESIIKGQEEERKRLARDLHDGLGGILSSAKHSFSNMKNNSIISEESNKAFENGIAILDKSISELRRVAHNMMPEALVKFGLNTAIQDLCESIHQNGKIELTYQSFDLKDEDVSKNKIATIYRIIQELVNNILKHSDAKTALVQFIKTNDVLSITVEDDGKGFDLNDLKNSSGIGYLNLNTRIAYINGVMDIQTAPEKGTSITIEIPNISHD